MKSSVTHTKKTRSKTSVPIGKSLVSKFPIVAIGASAGGLEAITELLKNLPSDTGMSFIYVQHLSPDHKSLLVQILSKATKMKVQEIDDMDKIKPDNVFVIPYNKGVKVTDGHIKLLPRSKSRTSISIDILFTSLARSNKERVIGVILSGSAGDGTQGMKDIKHEGGLTFAQDDSAKFTSMPHSAIAAGAVDFILSPKEIALELTRLSKNPLVKTQVTRAGKEVLIDNSNPDLKNILNLLLKTTGGDFSQYKMNTIKRRIVRRMLLYRLKTLKEYGKLLNKKKEEIDILYQDLLINVTRFFRETDTHNYLKATLLPKLLKSKKQNEMLRIWVPACSTGEEAFSIAMMLIEIQDNKINKIPVQIFASDLSEKAINKARSGLFSKQDLESVSPVRIKRFFTAMDGGYRIVKGVRDICVFATHNILTDPPFSRLDFVSCCNLFIYLDTPAQKKSLNTFHYALNDNGYLMLGKSENIGLSAHLFSDFYKKYKIYLRKKNSGVRTLPVLSPRFDRKNVPQINLVKNKENNFKTSKKKSIPDNRNLESIIDAVLLSEFMPASVVINRDMEIQQFRGLTDLYLTHAPGKASFNILKMVRPEIAFELRNAISTSIKTRKRVHKSGIEMKLNSKLNIINIEVVPLESVWDEPLLLILFTKVEQVIANDHTGNGHNRISQVKDRRIKKLEEELASAHADGLTFYEEQEAFNEELQIANDSLIEANIELQISNKELESFTYVSSHDLQEPLRKIQTLGGMILEKESQNLSEKGENYFRLMQNAAQRMRTLIQDLLAFSRLNKSERKFEKQDLNKIVNEIKVELNLKIKEKHASIEVGKMCELNIIPFQFRQLFHNLLSNALKFSNPKVSPHIIVKGRNIQGNKNNEPKLIPGKKYCHISVSDNGIGFDNKFSDKIFEVFQRLHGKDEFAGTGIGLAIVKKIVENHNGLITATGTLNKGATFDIYIPAMEK